MVETQQLPLKKIIADVAIVTATAIGIILFEVQITPASRGFFCDDDSIRYPYLPNTIPTSTLIIVSISVPSLVISINEFFRRSTNKCSRMKPVVVFSRTIPPWVWNAYKHVGVFLFGSCFTAILMDIGKVSVGRLRPHFMTVCQPDLEALCSQADKQHEYITEYTCKEGIDAKTLREIRLSFPSGHAAFSAFSMIYLSLYLQFHVNHIGSKLTKPFVQLILISLALYCGLTRISGYQHHPTDVLAGFILGIAAVIFITYFVSDFFQKPTTSDEDQCSNKCDTQHEVVDIERQ